MLSRLMSSTIDYCNFGLELGVIKRKREYFLKNPIAMPKPTFDLTSTLCRTTSKLLQNEKL